MDNRKLLRGLDKAATALLFCAICVVIVGGLGFGFAEVYEWVMPRVCDVPTTKPGNPCPGGVAAVAVVSWLISSVVTVVNFIIGAGED